MRVCKIWTTSDLRIIKENWKTKTDIELASILNTSHKSVQAQRLRMNLKRPLNTSGLSLGLSAQYLATKKGKPFTSLRKGKKLKLIAVYSSNGTRKIMTYGKFLWIEKNGSIPDGYEVMFKDGNTFNTDPENLMLMTRSEGSRYTQLRRSTESRKKAASLMIEKRKRKQMLQAYLDHKPYEFDTNGKN